MSVTDDIVIMNADGKKIAVGETSPKATLDQETTDVLGVKMCRHSFKVTGVPVGGDVYSIQIGDSDVEDFTPKTASDVSVVGEVA